MRHPDLTVLQDYFENALSVSTEKKVRAHVTTCDKCTAVLGDFAVIENKVKNSETVTVSQNTQARILLDGGVILRKKREYLAAKRDFTELAREWRENILPEIRTPALQFCSVSLMLITFIAIEKNQSLEETVIEPLSSEVKVYTGENNS
jgi:hypothetical protein